MTTTGSYRAYYTDTANDPYHGIYISILNEYESGANQPQALRNKVYTSGNAGGPMSHLLLVRDPNQVGDGAGNVVAYHRATRHDAIIGQTTPFDGVGFAFMGDLHGQQPPITVVLADDLFNSVNATQVPTTARMDQLLAADPTAKLVGPFAATDADVEAVTVRRIMYVPPKYMLMALDTALTPRQAWMQIKGAIIADGKEADCEELIKWLRVSLTRKSAGDQPRITVTPPSAQQIMNPQHIVTFQTYRTNILHRDLPHLSPNHITAGAQAIAINIAELATETRLTREEGEARRVQDSNKMPSDLYGPALNRLLRIAQVATETALQPIYSALAKATKQRHRPTLQAAFDTAIEDLGYAHDLPLTATLVKRVLNLEYYSSLEDDFAVGLNIFCVGQLEPETIEEQRQLIVQTDALLGNEASPSLADLATLLKPAADVCIPRTIPQLRDNVEKYHALMLVLLGSTHQLVIETKKFREALVTRERRLEKAQPRDQRHRYIVPALIARRFQLDANYWFIQQAKSARNIDVPDLNVVFHEIARRRDWAPDFPDKYLTQPSDAPPVSTAGGAPSADMSAITTPSGVAPHSAGASTCTTTSTSTGDNSQVRNDKYNSIYEVFKNMGHRIAEIKDRCKTKGIQLPKNKHNRTMCLSWHVKGFCNTRCSSKEDHREQDAEEVTRLQTWCQECHNLNE